MCSNGLSLWLVYSCVYYNNRICMELGVILVTFIRHWVDLKMLKLVQGYRLIFIFALHVHALHS